MLLRCNSRVWSPPVTQPVSWVCQWAPVPNIAELPKQWNIVENECWGQPHQMQPTDPALQRHLGRRTAEQGIQKYLVVSVQCRGLKANWLTDSQ